MSASQGRNANLAAWLTPHQVSICSLLIQYAEYGGRDASAQALSEEEQQAEQHLFDALFREVRAASTQQLTNKPLIKLMEDFLPAGADTQLEIQEIWDTLVDQLGSIDSPDALFDVFQVLEQSIGREVGQASPMHATGIFGQFARRCLMAFKTASFEVEVRLFDSYRRYIEEFSKELSKDPEGQRGGNAGFLPEAKSVKKLRFNKCTLSDTGSAALPQLVARELPRSLGSIAFPRIEAALKVLQQEYRNFQGTEFLKYVNNLQHRMDDEAGQCLRAFHDGTQQRGISDLGALGWPLAMPSEEGTADMIQHATLALAGIHSEMRHVDDALQALGESIRSAQEASDAGCLCACLYMFSVVLLRAGLSGKALAMLRQCLHRAEAVGSPTLQSLCCLSISRTLAERPSLADRRQRGLLWKESISRMTRTDNPIGGNTPGMRSQQGVPGTPRVGGPVSSVGGVNSNGASANVGSRGALGGFLGTPQNAQRGGLGVLAAFLHDESSASGVGGGPEATSTSCVSASSAACRDALSYAVVASQLATQSRRLSDSRPKALLCMAEVARPFGLQQLAGASCGLALDVYRDELVAEERALALCQLATVATESNLEYARPLLRSLAETLPHSGHLWAHIVGPCLVRVLLAVGECTMASALLFQVVGVARAVPHSAAAHASQQFRRAANKVRLFNQQFLAVHRSAMEAVEDGQRGGTPSDICAHLLCIADALLEAGDPIGALGPCLRCLSAAQDARLLPCRAEALVRIARIRLMMRDLAGALHLAEEVTPQLHAGGSAKLKGEAFLVQADVLLHLLVKFRRCPPRAGDSDAGVRSANGDNGLPNVSSRTQILQEVVRLLEGAVLEFEAVAEVKALRRCHYVLARVCHELRETASRNKHATRFRRITEFLSGSCSWDRLGLPSQAGHAIFSGATAFQDHPSRPDATPSGFSSGFSAMAAETPQRLAGRSNDGYRTSISSPPLAAVAVRGRECGRPSIASPPFAAGAGRDTRTRPSIASPPMSTGVGRNAETNVRESGRVSIASPPMTASMGRSGRSSIASPPMAAFAEVRWESERGSNYRARCPTLLRLLEQAEGGEDFLDEHSELQPIWRDAATGETASGTDTAVGQVWALYPMSAVLSA